MFSSAGSRRPGTLTDAGPPRAAGNPRSAYASSRSKKIARFFSGVGGVNRLTITNVSALATTPAQMQALAREWMPLDRMTVVVVGDLATIEQQVRSLPELQDMPVERVDPFSVE